MDGAPDIPMDASAPAEPKGPSLEPSNAAPASEAAPADSVHAPSTDVDKEDTRADPAAAEHSGDAPFGGRSPPGEPAVEAAAAVAEEKPPRRARRAAAAAASAIWDPELTAAAQWAADEAAIASIRIRKKRSADPAAQEAAQAAAPPPPTAPPAPVAPAEQPLPQAHPEQLERCVEVVKLEEDELMPMPELAPAPAPAPAPAAAAAAAQRRSSRARQRSRVLGEDMMEEIPDDLLNACFDSDGEAIEAAPPRPRPAPPPPPPPKRARPALGLSNQTLGSEDAMLGCPKCRWSRGGCGQCRERPSFSRPSARWNPGAGRPQTAVTNAPTFRPTPEEWAEGPISYISKIMPEAMQYGLAHIVPPSGWIPPFALEKGTNGLSMDSFKFNVRKQPTSQLCYRSAPRPGSGDGGGSGGAAAGRYGRKPGGGAQHEEPAAVEQPAPEPVAAPVPPAPEPEPQAPASPPPLSIEDIKEALAFANPGTELPPISDATADAPPPAPEAAPPPPPPSPTDFGFVSLDRKHTLRSFSAYADWAKAVHFSCPAASGAGTPSAPGRRPASLPHHAEPPVEPSVEEIEAEFWRIVETPGAPGPVEALYGQDLDSGHHGSGFPLPEWRRELLERHLNADMPPFAERITLPPLATPQERTAAADPWNINNMPRCPSSVLSVLPTDDLITGVMVPWLYVGSCLSAFCWHVEDHALYSVNFLHMGAPKVWYGVPATATRALEEAMADALPHLFAANPRLLHQLVTTLSPAELARRGVPVHRVVHEAGSFVVTMPDAYHAGFNTGFNCAEAVNFAAPGWLPYGTDIAQKYRDAGKPVTMSHDALLVSLATAALHIPRPGGNAAAPAALVPAAAATEGDQTTPQDSALEGGNIPWAQAPLQGVILGAGDLALRADEEAARWAAGLAELGLPSLPQTRMAPWSPSPGLKDEHRVHLDTAEVDCAECSGDLWLAAVVSAEAPGTAVCPQHAAALVSKHGCSRESLRMLCRHTPDELQALVTVAAARVEGVAAAAAAARARRARNEAERVLSKLQGPLYPTDEEGRWLGPQTPAASGPPREEPPPAVHAVHAAPAVDDEAEDVEVVVTMPTEEPKAEPEEAMQTDALALAPPAPPAAAPAPLAMENAAAPAVAVHGHQKVEDEVLPVATAVPALAAVLAPVEPVAPTLPTPLLQPVGEEMEVDIVSGDGTVNNAAVDVGTAAPAPAPQA